MITVFNSTLTATFSCVSQFSVRDKAEEFVNCDQSLSFSSDLHDWSVFSAQRLYCIP